MFVLCLMIPSRKMDMLGSDLQLKTESKSKKSSKAKDGHDENDSDASFHFIAFVPAMRKVWKFDGLERQPQTLGKCVCVRFRTDPVSCISVGECSEEDWLELVKPDILTRMAAYEEDQIEFSILGLVRDPLPELLGQLAVNVRCLEILNQRILSQTEEEPEPTLDALQETILGPDSSLPLTREDINTADVSIQAREYDLCSAAQLQQAQQELSNAQRSLRASIQEEKQSQWADADYAAGRRFDYAPAVRTWLRCLARKQLIQELQW